MKFNFRSDYPDILAGWRTEKKHFKSKFTLKTFIFTAETGESCANHELSRNRNSIY